MLNSQFSSLLLFLSSLFFFLDSLYINPTSADEQRGGKSGGTRAGQVTNAWWRRGARMWGAACWSDRLMRHSLVCVAHVVVCIYMYVQYVLPLAPMAPLFSVSVVPLPVFWIL